MTLSFTWMPASPLSRLTTLNGMRLASSVVSSKRRPMKRLAENTVPSGFVIAWRFAI